MEFNWRHSSAAGAESSGAAMPKLSIFSRNPRGKESYGKCTHDQPSGASEEKPSIVREGNEHFASDALSLSHKPSDTRLCLRNVMPKQINSPPDHPDRNEQEQTSASHDENSTHVQKTASRIDQGRKTQQSGNNSEPSPLTLNQRTYPNQPDTQQEYLEWVPETQEDGIEETIENCL